MNNIQCPHCTNDDKSLMELILNRPDVCIYLCSICGKEFIIVVPKA